MTKIYNSAMPVDTPLVVESADSVQWDESCEVLVVGFGAAGAASAIVAKEAQADVRIIDRFGMGGATAKSGGVVYAGGGTKTQQKLGIEDSPEEMFKYLRQESGDSVSEETLRRFCNDSLALIEWLESLGASFDSDATPPKTSYPKNGIYLYYSGNESILPFAEHAKPAPRGHRTVDKGLSGKRLFSHLEKRVNELGIPVTSQCAAKQLIVNSKNEVLGVKTWRIPAGSEAAIKHEKLIRRADFLHNGLPAYSDKLRRKAEAIEKASAIPVVIRATHGVILTTGGFIFNRDMVNTHAPKYMQHMRLGTTGCDGSGIRLGQSVGGAVKRMDKVSAWRFINPPQSWAKGAVVDMAGKRFCNEASYGARLGVQMSEEHDGKAWLIIDGRQRIASLKEALFGGLWSFQAIPAILLMLFAKKSRSIIGLAEKINVPPATLHAEIHAYNHLARQTTGADALGKTPDRMQCLNTPPYLAMNISAVDNPLFPCPTITLGGLCIDENTGAVVDEQQRPIKGLYAAGRAAVGIASNGYVSGLSLADCLWSGRRAGAAATLQDSESLPQPTVEAAS